MTGAAIHESIQKEIGALFTCTEHGDYTRIRTPYLYPDGDYIDLFYRCNDDGALHFVWPIWTPGVGVEILRSLLALRHLHERPLHRSSLLARGIEEVYCSRWIRPNPYYSNFEPARPLP